MDNRASMVKWCSFPITFPNKVSEVIQKSAVEIKPLYAGNRNLSNFMVCYNRGNDWVVLLLTHCRNQNMLPEANIAPDH